jgi:tetratricopeptide (TPR) repeat protein
LEAKQMQQRTNRLWLAIVSSLSLGIVAASHTALAQQSSGGSGGKSGSAPAPTIDAQTGKTLNEAIELLNMEKYAEAQAKIGTLALDKLSPYERSKVEQILFSISYTQEKYDDARGHLQKAIQAGGFNEQEVQNAKFQFAQLFILEEKWKDGAAALEDWFKTAMNPNSAAYYMLAIAYYQQDQFDKAMDPAKKAVELMGEKPQESYVSLLLALYMQKEQYKQAAPLLERLVQIVPDKKNYWMQLSNVYGLMEDYPKALASMQAAYALGHVTDDADYRRLADLLLYNEVPYRGAQILETGIEKKAVKLDDKLYEKLANCWIAAGEFDKAIQPLQKAGELAPSGDVLVRLGEVQVQREDWPAAIEALQKGLDKGQVKDPGNAQLLIGIAYYNQKKFNEAKPWLERAQKSEKHRQSATSYLQAIAQA